MVSRKPHTIEARTIIEIIASGTVDTDLQLVRNALAKRFRERKDSRSLITFAVGEHAVIKPKEHLRYLPTYVAGALVLITEVNFKWDSKLHERTDQIGFYRVRVEQLISPPRGGPNGAPPRCAVGSRIHVEPWEILPVTSEGYREKFDAIANKYKTKGTDNG